MHHTPSVGGSAGAHSFELIGLIHGARRFLTANLAIHGTPLFAIHFEKLQGELGALRIRYLLLLRWIHPQCSQA